MRAISLVMIAGVSFWRATAPTWQESTLDGSRLRAGIDTFVTTTVRGGATDTVGWATQSLVQARTGEHATWVQVYRWHGGDGSESTDSLVMDASSLHPRHESRTTSAGSVAVKYSGVRVQASVAPARGPARRVDTSYAKPVFSSASLDAIARAIPRQSNYSAPFELYYPFPAPYGVRTARLTVSGTATAPSRDHRSVDCWVVVAELPSGTTKFWVAKESGAIVQFASGEGDARFLFLRPGVPGS